MTLSTVRHGPAVFLMVALPLAAVPVAAQTDALTGAWVDENGLITCVRQVGNRVFWTLDDRPRVHNVYCGVVAGAYVTGEWADLPGGQMQGAGALSLRIEARDRFVKVGQTADYLGSTWTRTDSGACAATPRTRTPPPPSGLSGSWVMEYSDPYQKSQMLMQLTPEGPGVYRVALTLLASTHPVHKRSVCQTSDGGTFAAVGESTFEYRREAQDPNPANPGRYLQTATLTLDPETGTLSGEGTHQGSSITHSFKLTGKRGTDARCQ